MSQTSPTPNQRLVTELKVSAHMMALDPGTFCVFHAPGTPSPDAATGLPGVRIGRAPAVSPEAVQISTFNADGWLGGENGAALVRVSGGPAQILVTIYQTAASTQDAPKLQVLRLSDNGAGGAAAAPAAQAAGSHGAGAPAPAKPQAAAAAGGVAAAGQQAAPGEKLEVAAHVQRRGDLLTRIGDWMGDRGSQNWIEGFAIQPARMVDPADIEYQAVLGKGWLSPWAEGGKYCGSRGMALPILGLRVRLKGKAAEAYAVRVHATFIDGTTVGPIDGSQTAEAESLAPLEAFKVEFLPLREEVEAAEAPTKPTAKAAAKPATPAKLVRAAPPRAAARAPVQVGAHPSAKGSAKPQAKIQPKTQVKPTKGGRAR